MDCQEVRDLLPAYALGALDPEELAAVEEHLGAGHEHDAELAELRATVFALDQIADDPLLAGDYPALGGDRAAASSAGGPLSRIATAASWRAIAAAVAVLLVFGAGWLAGQLVTDSSGTEVVFVVEGADGELVELTGETAAESVTVTMAGFERLPEGSGYQLWAIRDGSWLSIGVCNTNAEGRWVGDFAFKVQSGEQIALTVEPADGSPAPTTEPLLRSGT